MVVNVVKLTQDLIEEARKGTVFIPLGPIVFQRGGKGGCWFKGSRITPTAAKVLLRLKAREIGSKKFMKDLLKQAREGGVFLNSVNLVFQPKGRGNNWFLGTLIPRDEAVKLLNIRAREIKNFLKA